MTRMKAPSKPSARNPFRKGSVVMYYGTPVTVFRVNRDSVCVTSPAEDKPFAVSKALLLEFNPAL